MNEHLSPGDERVQTVVRLLRKFGYSEDGSTQSETVRVPTTASPVFNHGASGGELRTFGGRVRFKHPCGLKATVGKITTYLYGGVTIDAHLRTHDLTAIGDELRARHGLPKSTGEHRGGE